ncbi:hypothetical protein HQ487_00115 [Candidatus Uhrbacteria bacterium]|nr:hypothetical protein [Candidatus Uhrbacteria bacterium]
MRQSQTQTTGSDTSNPYADFEGDGEYTPDYANMGKVVAKPEIVVLGSVTKTVLINEFSFSDTDLTGLGADNLAVLLASCQAANELANLAGPVKVAVTLEWSRSQDLPETLAGFGVERLSKFAGDLQVALEEAKKKAEIDLAYAQRRTSKIKPRTEVTLTPTPAPVRTTAPTPKEKPEGADWLGRITTPNGMAYRCVCGCNVMVLEDAARVPPFDVMQDRQGSRIGGKDLWAHAFAPGCIKHRGRNYNLHETQLRAFKAEAEDAKRAKEHAARAPAPFRTPPKPACFGSTGAGPKPANLAKRTKRIADDIKRGLKTKGKGGQQGQQQSSKKGKKSKK